MFSIGECMKNEKVYLTIEEQIELLKSKGLQIKSEKLVRKYLSDIGYYKLINGYKFPFIILKKDDDGNIKHEFKSNTDIEDLYQLYKFDQDLKSLIQKNISHIEVKVKARMSDFISQNFGIKEKEYLKPDHYKPDSNKSNGIKFIDLRNDILKSISSQHNKHNSITWYANNYGYYPFWVVSNILTLGTISLLYSKMKQPDQYTISKTFGVKSKLLENMLMLLLLFRNKCAHNEIAYCYKTKRSLNQNDLKEIFTLYNIPIMSSTGRYKYGLNDVFGLIICFKILLDKSQFSEFSAQFKSLLNNLKKRINNDSYNSILDSMGIVGDIEILKNYKFSNN